MFNKTSALALLCGALFVSSVALAEGAPEEAATGEAAGEALEIPPDLLDKDGNVDTEKLQAMFEKRMQGMVAELNWQTGKVELPGGYATLNLGEEYRYLDPAASKTVLEDLWGNPPGPPVLGMIFPKDVGPGDENNWGVVIDEYNQEGFVEDDDAEDMDYNELLSEMQSDAEAANPMRKEQGYPTVKIIGWAEPPHYDKGQRKLYWARELEFDDSPDHTLNYDIRVLGRRGYLQISAISPASMLPQVRAGMGTVLGAVEFTEGHRYEDFDPELDKVAAYGLGALVAGKLAMKTGLFAGLLAILFKAKKLVIVAVVAIGALFAKMFGKKD